MIKCEDFKCCYYNPHIKRCACSREADPHTCKGYLNTIISIQQRTIEEMEKKIKSDILPCVQEVFDCISESLWDNGTHIDIHVSEDNMKHEYPFSWSCQRLDCLATMLNDINDI